MCSKEHFYDWSDINLDEILGEYTDDDDMNEESTSSSDSYVYEGESEKPDSVSSKAVKRTTDGEFTFDCPVCRKVLRSVSGFRGHVLKQHPSMDRSDFRGKLKFRHSVVMKWKMGKLIVSWAEVSLGMVRERRMVPRFLVTTLTLTDPHNA